MRKLVFSILTLVVIISVYSFGSSSKLSLDKSWTVKKSIFGSLPINAITYGNNRFIAVGNEGKMSYSSDGASWTIVKDSGFRLRNKSDTHGLSCDDITVIAYGNGRFAAGGYANSISGRSVKMAYSSDGITWTSVRDNPFSGNGSTIHTIDYGNGRFIAVGNGYNGFGRIAYSSDGNVWTTANNAPFNNVHGGSYVVTYGNGRFVIVNKNTGQVAYSSVGGPQNIMWTAGESNLFTILGNRVNTITYCYDSFIAIGVNGNQAYSDNVLTWTTLKSNPFGTSSINAITYGRNRCIIAGNGQIAWRTWPDEGYQKAFEEEKAQARKIAESEVQKSVEAQKRTEEQAARKATEKEKRATQSPEEWRKWIAANIDLNNITLIYKYLKLSIFDIYDDEELKQYKTDLQRKVFLQSKEAVPFVKEVEMVRQYILNYEFHKVVQEVMSDYDITRGGFWIEMKGTGSGLSIENVVFKQYSSSFHSDGKILLKVPEDIAVNIEGNRNIRIKMIYKISDIIESQIFVLGSGYVNRIYVQATEPVKFVFFNAEKNTDIYTVKEIQRR